ncbi:MAG: ribonuclease III [Deltaproteobacteria bacterium]|nr:ribonuclease III [Deltaproteobacteria bacterium]
MDDFKQQNDFSDLNQRLSYTFKNPTLLEEAFRHASFVNENPDLNLADNERLEFLGDAQLDQAIRDILMRIFEDAKEGHLSKYRASLVNERGLYQLAKELQLGNHLLLGRGEQMSRGHRKPSILANTFEALMGALYLDAGFDATREIIHRLFIPLLVRIDVRVIKDDFKSMLQEFTQQTFKSRPEYYLIKESGPAHDKTFRIALRINGTVVSEGEGKSKKVAEQVAAREAFLCLTKDQQSL